MKRDIERLRELLDLSEDIAKTLDRLDKMQSTVSYLVDKYFLCGEDGKCEGLAKLVKRIEKWLRIYDCVEEYEPRRVMYMCLEDSATVDFNTLEVKKICIDLFDCVYLQDVKLPLNEDSKRAILDKLKSELRELVSKVEVAYSKTLVMIVELLREIEHDLTQLKENYKRLHEKLLEGDSY
jgi:hypothetical protein